MMPAQDATGAHRSRRQAGHGRCDAVRVDDAQGDLGFGGRHVLGVRTRRRWRGGAGATGGGATGGAAGTGGAALGDGAGGAAGSGATCGAAHPGLAQPEEVGATCGGAGIGGGGAGARPGTRPPHLRRPWHRRRRVGRLPSVVVGVAPSRAAGAPERPGPSRRRRAPVSDNRRGGRGGRRR